MQVNLDYGGSRSLLRFVEDMVTWIKTRPTWIVIFGAAVVLFVILITKKRK